MLRPARASGLVAHVPVGIYVERVSVEEVVDSILYWQRAGETLDSRFDVFDGDIGKPSETRAQDADVVPFAAVGDDAIPHMLVSLEVERTSAAPMPVPFLRARNAA
jgi:hypothetical protein